ncbi:unnamed protein product [Paramecium pentaurelia]|uniref:Uncharacterized protein n=2 Tax=Paramecium pentaurelia TaxID=43138 RepID=A0A8S1U0B1_9CILI|nr:unnamed protein product [Paramecium pentaurelia]
MQKYKSIKTWERLNKIKAPVPKYEYDNFKEIDEKFKQFEEQQGDPELSNTTTAFGTILIQTAVQGLHMANAFQSQGQPVNRLSQSILKAFDINPNQLNQLKTSQDRHEYIKLQMNSTIDTLLKNWSDKIILKEQKYKETDQQMKKEKINNQTKKHFKWLQLKTKYEQLKNKLRQIVVDKLNDYENQQMAVKSQNKHLMLKNVQVITTRHIFENMEKYGHSNEFHFLKSLGQDRLKHIKERQNRQMTQQFENINDEEQKQSQYQVIWNNQQEKIFTKQRSQTKQLFTNEIACSNWNDLGFLPILQQMTLNEKKKQQREHILNKYTDGEFLTAQELQFLANTSELLNACLDKEFFQRATNQVNPDLLFNMELSLAEQILKDYGEMKSATINARLQYIRMKIEKTKQKLAKREKRLQKQSIDAYNMELNRKYIKVCKTVVKHMERTGKFEEKIPSEIPGATQLKDYLMGRITERQFITKLYDYVFEKERRRQYIDLNDEDNLFQNYPSKQQIASSKQIQPQSPRLKNEKNKRQEYIKQMARPKSTIGIQFTQNIKRHVFHPSTKLLIDKKLECEDNELAYINPIYAQYNKQEQEKFKLGLKSHPALRQRRNFLKFYSGGPPNQPELEHWKSPNYQPTQREIRAAIMIQRKLRSLFREKKLRQKLEERRKQIYYLFKDNCENMIHQIELGQDQQVSYFYLNKQLERCKTIAKDQINFSSIKTEENTRKNTEKKSFLLSTGASTPTTKGISTLRIAAPSNKIKVDYLFEAVQKNRIMMIKQSHFVYSANDVNSQNYDGITPLHVAVVKGNWDFVEWLLQNGADPYIMDQQSITPIDMARHLKQTKIIRLFEQYQKI